MQYKCETCYDTGSRDQIGTYLDCNECNVAQTRRDLNDFVKSLGPLHPEDVALAIHQRALAMAPKQEAPTQEPVAEIISGWQIVFVGAGPIAPIVEKHKLGIGAKLYAVGTVPPPEGWRDALQRLRDNTETFSQYSQETARVAIEGCIDALEELEPVAAPAVANGALTDDADLGEGLPSLPEAIEVGGEGWGWEDFQSQKTFSAEHMFNYARAAIALAASANGSPIDERAAFEASKPTMHIKRNHFGMYENLYVHHAWEAWQDRAALAALIAAAGPDAALIEFIQKHWSGAYFQGVTKAEAREINEVLALSGAKGN